MSNKLNDVVAFVLARLRDLYNCRQMLKGFIIRDLRGRYVGSSMGFFWSVINPLLMLLIYTFVFSVILKVRFESESRTAHFALYLFCGYLPWIAFQESLYRSTNAVVEHANLIKKAVFPSKILPLYLIVSSLINELVGLAVLVVAISILMHPPTPVVLLFPLIVFLQLMLTVGLGWILAATNVFFRDTIHLIGVVLLIWMFLTPLFYPESMVPKRFAFFLQINPMAHLIRAYRDVFLGGQLPSLSSLAVLAGMSLVFFISGFLIFEKTQPKFVDML